LEKKRNSSIFRFLLAKIPKPKTWALGCNYIAATELHIDCCSSRWLI